MFGRDLSGYLAQQCSSSIRNSSPTLLPRSRTLTWHFRILGRSSSFRRAFVDRPACRSSSLRRLSARPPLPASASGLAAVSSTLFLAGQGLGLSCISRPAVRFPGADLYVAPACAAHARQARPTSPHRRAGVRRVGRRSAPAADADNARRAGLGNTRRRAAADNRLDQHRHLDRSSAEFGRSEAITARPIRVSGRYAAPRG